jgi:hypothetical protein
VLQLDNVPVSNHLSLLTSILSTIPACFVFGEYQTLKHVAYQTHILQTMLSTEICSYLVQISFRGRWRWQWEIPSPVP